MKLTEVELSDAILEELRNHSVLTLATVGDARPHAVSLMYAHKDFDIYWLSDPKTMHSEQLAHNASAGITIARQQEDFRRIRGLQLEGEGYRITDPAKKAMGLELLVARYPFLKQFRSGNLARHLGLAAIYTFHATKLILIDNSRGFGFKQALVPDDRSGRVVDPV